jgi:hypothetical protein
MANKEAERQAIDDFSSLYDEFPQGEIESREEPDFIVGGRVGIEVTDYFRPEPWSPSPPQEQEALQRRIVNAAEKLWVEGGHPPRVVNVIFDPGGRLAKRDILAVAHQLVSFAVASLSTDAAFGRPLPEGVGSVTVYPYKHLAWLVSGAVWPPDVDESELRRIITKKETKLPQYQKACAENWLLIVVSGGRRASLSLLPQSFTSFKSSFERVLLLFERLKVLRIA